MRPDVRQVAAEGNITWIAPQANDTLLAGQNYTAKWSGPFTPNSPILRLCVEQGDEPTKGSCGAWVAAPVQQVNESYFVSLTLPNVSSTDPFVLRVHDDPNPDVVSPSFFIQPASPSNDTSSTAGTIFRSAGAPGLSFQLPHQSNSTSDPLVVLMPSDAPRVPRARRDLQIPDILHPTPMFIAFSIIPIVLLVGALVTFVIIWVRQRRSGQLKKLYLTEHPIIYPRRPVPNSLVSNEDLEDAVQTLAYERFRSEKVLSATSDEKQGKRPRIEGNQVERMERRDEEAQARVPAGPRAIQPRPAHGAPASHPDPGRTFNRPDSSQRPQSYVPEPRNLTASYFPPVLPPLDLSSDTARENTQGAGSSTGHSEGSGRASMNDISAQGSPHSDDADLDGYGLGTRLVESPIPMQSSMSSIPMPMGMGPPPPSVTKLSERLHLRRRSESWSATSRRGDPPTVSRVTTRYLEQERMREEVAAKDLR